MTYEQIEAGSGRIKEVIEREGAPDRREELRLGWLDVFLTVAHHRDYGLAGKELGVAPDSVRRCIRRLEAWTGRLLVQGHGSLTLSEPDGSELILLATDVLNEFGVACARLKGGPSSVTLGNKAKLRLSDLERVTYVATRKHYKGVGKDPDKVMDIRRQIASIEKVVGQKLFATIRTGTISGRVSEFIHSIDKICRKLRGFQSSKKDLVLEIREILKKDRAAVREAITVWETKNRLSPPAKREMMLAKEKIRRLDNAIASVEEKFDLKPKVIRVSPQEIAIKGT